MVNIAGIIGLVLIGVFLLAIMGGILLPICMATWYEAMEEVRKHRAIHAERRRDKADDQH